MFAARQFATHDEVVHASAQLRNFPHAVAVVAQAVAWLTQALPGPTDASAQSLHDSARGAALTKA